jgi:DNA ligase-1
VKRFAQLFAELDTTTATSAKVDALKRYFASAQPRDAAWAVYFLAGGTPRQLVRTALLRSLACERAGIDDWLFEASYQAVGDFAETVAYILPPPEWQSDVGLADWIETRLLPLRDDDPVVQAERVAAWWNELETPSRFLLNKLMGGGFRVGVSKLLVQRALAEHAGIDAKLVARRMMGYTDSAASPGVERYQQLTAGSTSGSADAGQPYPFFLAHALEIPLSRFTECLGPAADWFVEWKYDGIRAQVVKRDGQTWVWSRGEELVTDRFPEIVAAASALPDGTVLDGEVVVWKDDAIAPFSLLQRRIGRKSLSKSILAEAPVGFIAYDLLELNGVDLRERNQEDRRKLLEALVTTQSPIHISPIETRPTWEEYAALRQESRARGVEGFMLKHRFARYGVGRRKQEVVTGGAWWKWKIDPLSVDAVLVYAQAGHGRRAGVYTDYTFAVWNRSPKDAAEAQAVVDAIERRDLPGEGVLQLVAFAKAYSGLTDEEFREVDRIIRQTTLEKFGPVRSVKPSLVFEIGFEGINRSTRHKSGIAVRFPRMLRVRDDKPLHEADTLQALEALLAFHHNGPGGSDVDSPDAEA